MNNVEMSDAALAEHARAAIIAMFSYAESRHHLQRLASTQRATIHTIDTRYQRVVIVVNEHDIWVGFAGSDHTQVAQYVKNLNHGFLQNPLAGNVHRGFYHRYTDNVIAQYPYESADGDKKLHTLLRKKIEQFAAAYPDARIHLCGHSSGGAMALLCAADIAKYAGSLVPRIDMICTFGQPRVGDADFIASIEAIYPNIYTRYNLANDPIPNLPPIYPGNVLRYAHGGSEILLHSFEPPQSVQTQKLSLGYLKTLSIQKLEKLVARHSTSAYIQGIASMQRQSSKDLLRTHMFQGWHPIPEHLPSEHFQQLHQHGCDVLHYLATHAPTTEIQRSIMQCIEQHSSTENTPNSAEDTLENYAKWLGFAYRSEKLLASLAATGDDRYSYAQGYFRDVIDDACRNNPIQACPLLFAAAIDHILQTQSNHNSAVDLRVYLQRLQELATTEAHAQKIQHGLGIENLFKNMSKLTHVMRISPEITKDMLRFREAWHVAYHGGLQQR